MVLTTKSNTSSIPTTSSTKPSTISTSWTKTNKETTDYRDDTTGGYDSESTDDSQYANFLSFLSTPTSNAANKSRSELSIKTECIIDVAKRQTMELVNSCCPTETIEQLMNGSEEEEQGIETDIKHHTFSKSISEDEGSAWKSDDGDSLMTDDDYEAFTALVAPHTTAPTNTAAADVLPAKRTSQEDTKRTTPTKSKSVRTTTNNEPNIELPEYTKSASVATLYFETEAIKKQKEMESNRKQVVNNKELMEPLPIDHFTKLGEKETTERTESMKRLAEESMPIAISKMTAKATQDKLEHEKELKNLSEEQMSDATRHFKKLDNDKKLSSSSTTAEVEIMPAAIQRFTLADRELKAKKKAELQELRENPEPLPAAQEFFSNKDREEKERKAAELQDMKENPPPASVATEYFHKKEEERKVELEAMQNEPAPAAIEYFTSKAAEEKSKRDLMLKEMNESPPEASIATQYFEKQESITAAKMEAIRSQVKDREAMEPLPIDYFTKLGEEEQSNKALAQRELSESQMPIAVKKMTDKAAQDKAANEEAQRKLSQEEMSSATKHFHALEDEKKKASSLSVADSENEIMPAAIQRFTLADRELKAKKKAELDELKSNPEPLPAAQEFFTNKDREDKAKKAAELKALKENPPPASVATE